MKSAVWCFRQVLVGGVVLALSVAAARGLLAGEGPRPVPKDPPKGDPENKDGAKDPFCVVQVNLDFEIVRKSELSSFRKKLAAEHKEALKDWEQAKKAARKAKEKFSQPKPRPAKVKVISSSLLTMEDAVKLRDKTFARIDGYLVVDTGADLRVLRKSQLASLKKELEAEYQEAVRSYNDARNDARKGKRRFTEKKPMKPTVKVLVTGLPSEEVAEKRLEELRTKGKTGRGKKSPPKR